MTPDQRDTLTAAIAGPWVAETGVFQDAEQRGLAVLAVLPELARTPNATPTRGMVAWVSSGFGACATDEQAITTARLIAAAPDLLAALKRILPWHDSHPAEATDNPLINQCRAAIAKAEHQP